MSKGVKAVQLCPRCQRANPREAVYCYFDGIVLRQGVAGGASPSQLPQEFVFPSGRRCKTFDDLVQGCQYEWEDARRLLRSGDFARYFAQLGRHDLARIAGENQTQPDADIGLHAFLGQLPASQIQGPRLDLNPRRLLLGGVRPGEQRRITLTILNQGKGLLQGKVTVSEGGQWLKIAEDGNPAEYALKTARSQQIQLHVDARGLTAPQTYSGKLTVITNGGISEVAVRLDVTSLPFAQAPFQGAASPRQIAERMRANPKQAVPLLENGEYRPVVQNQWLDLSGVRAVRARRRRRAAVLRVHGSVQTAALTAVRTRISLPLHAAGSRAGQSHAAHQLQEMGLRSSRQR